MRTIIVTGSASGIGLATLRRLAGKGHRVIGVDLSGADINVDLGTEAGRSDMVRQVAALAPDGIDGVLASAGLNIVLAANAKREGAPPVADPLRPGKSVSVNYFGSIATLEGLRPLMRPGSRGVLVASAALMVTTPEIAELEELCLAGDEQAAVRFVEGQPEIVAYAAGKRALTRWLRTAAAKPEWGGAHKLLNVVAPGVILTPILMDAVEEPEAYADLQSRAPIAVSQYADATVVAELMEFLLTFENDYLLGQVIFIDGGTEALRRPDHL